MSNPAEKKRIILGSGKVYVLLFSGTIPDIEEIEKPENQLGDIQGGCTLEYKNEFYAAEDDLGLVKKEIMTKEEALMKTGILTWCASNFQKICSTAKLSEVEDKQGRKWRVVAIGGVGNQDRRDYIIHFRHYDPIDGDITVTIVGKNQAGFSFAFLKDKETVVNTEFKALPMNDEGTLIQYREEIKGAVTPPPPVTK